jgi:geranylgeranyl pyrophosphate synthase
LLLVGDAAGLISPFTGEGISFALESGRCAAEVINAALSRGDVRDLSEYGRRLGAQHAGYFELGRESARRYVLLWHVLESTFHNDKPLFALTRQAALFPEGAGEAYLATRLPNVRTEVGSLASTLRADLAAASDVLAGAVRTDWPFLARLTAVDQHDSGVPFRPALLLLLSTLCGGTSQPHAPALAAAVELGYLSTLAQFSVLDDSSTAGETAANWGNRFAVIVADFLLTRAYEISARSGVGVTQLIASSLATACESRAREMRHAQGARLTPLEYDEIITCKTGALFELPCLLGARLVNLSVADSNLLGTFGRHLGAAIQIAEDVRGASGVPREFSLSTDADSDDGLYGLPLLLALDRAHGAAAPLHTLLARSRSERDHLGIAKLLEETGALDDAFASAIAHRDRALAQVEMLAASPARDALKAIAYRVVTRDG